MNERILIVEDEAILALDLEQRLNGMGFVVVDTANTGLEAIESAERNRPDLVLMDIRLRGEMDGTEAARQIRSRLGLPVIFVTAFSDPATVGRAKLADPFGYVLKPFENREIALAIELALHKHQFEEKLRGVERWLAATLNSVGDAVVTLDLNGIVTLMNPAAEKLTGRVAAESIGRPFEEVVTIVGEDSREPVENPANRVLREGIILGLAKRSVLITALGVQIPVNDSAAPIRDEKDQVTGTVVVLRDAMEERRAEDARRKTADMDRHGLQIEAIGRLAGGIAHDLNNALAIILGHSELLQSGVTPSIQWQQSTQAIGNAAKRAADLTTQLLSFGRRQMLRPSIEDLSALVAENTRVVERLLGDRIVLRFKLDAQLPPIHVDRDRMHQVLINLAANARDAMPSGGALEIETAKTVVNPVFALDHRGLVAGPYVMLTVRDDGKGMSDETLSHLFEPFFTTKEVGRGSGMGLATVYGFVRQSGGAMTVSSEVGKGSTFRIYFPVAEKPAEPPAVVAAEPRNAETVGTLLLVEDEKDVRELLQRMLERNGYRVMTAANGREGFELFEKHSAEFALVVSDVLMPELTGPEMARRIQKLRPDMKFLFVSGNSETRLARHALPRGAALLPKPFSQEELLRFLREQLKGRP